MDNFWMYIVLFTIGIIVFARGEIVYLLLVLWTKWIIREDARKRKARSDP